jgi:transcriptional regulator with XRE-family HTH domain
MARQLQRDLNLALACLRVALGWSQKRLATATGISANLLSDYERGRKRLHREMLGRLVGKLGLDLAAVEETVAFLARIRRFEAPAPVPDLDRRDEEQPATALPGEVEREHRQAAVAQIRLLRGWRQQQLAAAAGVAPSSISNYERGKRTPSRKTLLRLADAAGVSQAALGRILGFVRSRSAPPVAPSAPPLAADPGAPAAEGRPGPWIEVGSSTAADRYHARQLWQQLEGRSAAEIRVVIEREPNLRHWALCEVIAGQSLMAAHDSAARARELAELAARVAELYPGPESWRLRLLGYAWGHLANAQRVSGKPVAAAETLHRGKRLWRSGPVAPMLPLSQSRLASLEVSILMDQWRLNEAIEVADQALTVPNCEDVPALLNNKGVALMRRGDARGGLRMFAQLHALVGAGAGLTEAFARYGLVHGLYNLGLYQRAKSLLPVLRQSMLALGNELTLLRVGWMEGRVAAAMGNEEEALESLTQVHAAYLTRNMHFDAAYVGLELADLLLARGRAAVARELTGAAAEVARSVGMFGLEQKAQGRLMKMKGRQQVAGERRNGPLHFQDWASARPPNTALSEEPAPDPGLSDQAKLTREFQEWAGEPKCCQTSPPLR